MHSLRFLARDTEPLIESAIGGLHPEAIIKYDERCRHGVDDRLRVLAFVDRLLNTGAEGRDVGETKHAAARFSGAVDLRRNLHHEAAITETDLPARRQSVVYHPSALLIDSRHIRQRLHVAQMVAHIR